MLQLCSFLLLCGTLPSVLPTPSVIIVGAGPAGIAAATKLLENSITNITVLEAEDRIGGRINSVRFGNGTVDLGAQYCHGEKGNVAYELAKPYGILEPGLRGMQKNVYCSNGSKLESGFATKLQGFYLNYHESKDLEFNTTGISLGELIIHKYSTRFGDDNSNPKLLKEGLRFLEGHLIIHEGSFSWFAPSAECDYTMCEGKQNLIWKGLGYKGVLDIMMKSYPNPEQKLPIDDKIRLGTPVQRIVWNKDEPSQVVTPSKVYSADYVIFTPSIGVLKRQKDTLFDPPLPPPKQEAIQATGFAGVMKIFFHFPEQWWKNEDQAFAFFWLEDDLTKLEIPWVSQLRYILKVPYNTNVWVGWVSGELVPEVEKLPLEALKTGCEYVFGKFLAHNYNVTKIGEILRTTWVSNQHFGGTYSYTKTGYYKNGFSYQAALAEPLVGVTGKPGVLFAGEATNLIHYQTVHGAIESGYREAERILSLEKKRS